MEPVLFSIGTRVDVRSRFETSWNGGFRVVEQTVDGVRLERESDHYVLPIWFCADDVRLAP
jgi:hypothetical protein